MTIPRILIDDSTNFPEPHLALMEPNGLLAIGYKLNKNRLIDAYSKGIFPWFNEGDPVLWWSPSIRAILYPHHFKLHRSLRKSIKQEFSISVDNCFEEVINKCASLRVDKQGTWINEDIIEAYCELHNQGIAHSIEIWFNEELVGGLYGLSLGHAFFGESMFHIKTNASKIALYALSKLKLPVRFDFIDCQLPSNHLSSLGVINMPRNSFLNILKKTLINKPSHLNWRLDPITSISLLD